MKISRLNFLIPFLLLLFKSFAQTEFHTFKVLDTKSGLSNNWVNSITEDSRGFKWIGTRSGLNIFGGASNEIISYNVFDNNSLSMNDISKVIYSKKDEIIAATWGGGINKVNPYSKKVIRIGKTELEKKFIVKSIAEDDDTTLWVGCFGQGVYRLNKSNVYKPVSFKPQKDELETKYDYVQDLLAFKGEIWVCSRNRGFGKINTKTNEIISARDQNGKIIDVEEIDCMVHHKDKILIGNFRGSMYLYDPTTKILSFEFQLPIDPTSVNRVSINNTKDGKFSWICSNKGIFIYDWHKKELIRIITNLNEFMHRENFISFLDSHGYFWIGNWGNGLFYYSQDLNNFNEVELPNNEMVLINSIIPYGKEEFLLGTGKGMKLYNKTTNKISDITLQRNNGIDLNNRTIFGLEKYKDKILIISDFKGFFLMDKNYKISQFPTLKNSLFKKSTRTCLGKLPNGDIWSGSWSEGVILLNDKTDEHKEFQHLNNDTNSLWSNSVFCVIQVNGKPWIGTMNGINVYNRESNSFSRHYIYLTIDGINSPITLIRAMVQTDEKTLWISCNYGLVKYNTVTKEAKLFTEKNGLVDGSIFNLEYDGTSIWATSKSGLIQILLKNEEIHNFTVRDGLSSNNFNENKNYLSPESDLYLCYGNKIVHFKTNKLNYTKKNIRFYIDRFYPDDDEALEMNLLKSYDKHSKMLNLKHNQNNLTFEVNIQDFNATQQDRYAYKLEGLDQKWIYCSYSNKKIRYTNLEPGTYHLYLAEVLPNSGIGKKFRKISISIAIPFWNTWWFYILIISLIIFTVWSYSIIKTKRILMHNKALAALIQERTKEIVIVSENLKAERDSIQSNVKYASLIQNSLMEVERDLLTTFSQHFIFNKPKDIVSGDFYWSHKIGSKTIFVVADCTGHGVSGAFMSVLGIVSLKNIVETLNETSPDKILNKLHIQINQFLHQEESNVTDGMDISVICYDSDTKELTMSSAMSSILFIYKNELQRIRGSKFPIGGSSLMYKTRNSYELFSVKLEEKIKIYLFSDGFQDQISELNRKKYMQPNFRELIFNISGQPFQKQRNILEETLKNWQGNELQVDDILIVGLELNPNGAAKN